MNNNIDSLIMGAMKSHDKARTETLRSIKAAFLNWKTTKENAGQELTEATELQIIRKLVKQRQESIENYKAAGRQDLVEEEQAQLNILQEYLPVEATKDDVIKAFDSITDLEPIKKNMGLFVKTIKSMLPNADGSLIASTVKERLQ